MISLIRDNNVRCVLPDAPLPLGENGKYMVDLFKEKYNVNIKYREETKTSTGHGTKGGRIDQIFDVQEESINQFDQIKDKIGALYAKEIVQNNEHHIYKERIYLTYFKRAEDELLKAGKISEEDVYQSIFP